MDLLLQLSQGDIEQNTKPFLFKLNQQWFNLLLHFSFSKQKEQYLLELSGHLDLAIHCLCSCVERQFVLLLPFIGPLHIPLTVSDYVKMS